MHKHYTKVIILCMSAMLLTGCTMPDKLSFLNKDKAPEVNEETGLTAEQEALIGTYTESGELIVGFDSSGMMITETVKPSIVDEVGMQPEQLLSQMTTYDNLVITLYDDDTFNLTPLYVVSYTYDNVAKVGKKVWFSSSDKGITYYNADQHKGWTNNNFTGWSEDNNNKIENLVVYFNPDRMKDIEMTADNSFIYITGLIDRTGIDRTPLMSTVATYYPNTTEMQLMAMYDRKDNMVTHVELMCNSANGSHRIDLSSVRDTATVVSIPDYITEEERPEVDVMSGVKNIPSDAYIYSVLYDLDSQFDDEGNRIITRDKLVEIYSFNRGALERKYDGIDVNAFLDYLVEFNLEISVEDLLTRYYDGLENGYTDIIEQAAYDSMYTRLRNLDSQMLEPRTDYPRKPPEKKRVLELTLDQDALIGTEAEDGSGIIEWFYEDGTPVIRPYTEEEKPAETEEKETKTMFTTTSVNRRSGPGTQYDKLGTCDPGQPIKVLGDAEEDPEWSECVDEEGNTFYIKTQYLK